MPKHKISGIGRGLIDRKLVEAAPHPHPPVILLLAVRRRLFCFGPLVIYRYSFLYIKIKKDKNRC